MRYHAANELIGPNEIKLVHVAASKLGLPREAYEAVLLGAAGVASSKHLTFAGYEKVMRRFKELGFKLYFKSPSPSVPSPQGRGNYPPPARGEGQGGGGKKMRPFTEPERGVWLSKAKQRAIYGLWEDVARVKTPKGLRSFLRNRFKADDVRFLDEEKGDMVIEALKQMKKRMDPKWSGKLGDY